MTETNIYILLIILFCLILLSGFFSGTETGMMALNRYRLRNLVRKNHPAAKRVNDFLRRTDRLLGVILIGNTFANVFASAVATYLAVRWFGELGVIFVTILLTLVILIFAEITPKTLAALHPERVAFLSSMPLKFLLVILYPLVWLANGIANGFLMLFRVNVKRRVIDHLSHEELRTVVNEAGGKISANYQAMLLSILDLEKVAVDDIMVPRNEVVGIDLDDDLNNIRAKLTASQHTRLPIYRDSIDQVQGILHARDALNLVACQELSKSTLLQAADKVYFIPEGTPLNTQLLHFQQRKNRVGLVVDEYGDILGLVTLEDILEEIIGEFTTDLAAEEKYFVRQKDGSYIVDGSMNIRDLNRTMRWEFPTDGPKTLSGLIVEYLETIPRAGIALRLAGYPIEIIEVKENTVKMVKIWPHLRVLKEVAE